MSGPALRLVQLGGVGLVVLLLAGCFTESKNQGARLYAQRCANCHGDTGQGLQRLIPPLAGADYLTRHRNSLACVLRKGLSGEVVVNGITFNGVMPGGEGLTDSEITNILNYVQQQWGNQGEPFTIREVADQLNGCGGARGL